MKYIITVLLTLLTSLTIAQNRLGDFIIDKTDIGIIQLIEKEIGKLEITNDLVFYNNSILNSNDPKFCEIILDEKCDELRIFFISQYFFDGLLLEDIYIFFHKNILIQIVCNKSTELEYYFAKKYGKPFKFIKDTPKIRSSTMEYDEHIVELLWKKGNVKAISYQNTQFFDSIPRDAGSYFIISNSLSQKIIRDCDNFKE
jgi:hypothetical protein